MSYVQLHSITQNVCFHSNSIDYISLIFLKSKNEQKTGSRKFYVKTKLPATIFFAVNFQKYLQKSETGLKTG